MTCALILAAVFSRSLPVAETPPMGWNSYDCFSYGVTEQQVKQNADFMAKRLKRFGWEYVVVDYVWSAPKLSPGFAPDQSPTFQPSLAMDAYGRLQPDLERFPSSATRTGFKLLADYCHNKGLKFGIHLMRGIPRQAVSLKTLVLGTGWNAEEAADQNSMCPWLNHMFGLNMAKPAGQAYLNSLFKQYAEWGVDFVKVDDLSRPYSKAEIEGYRVAIQRSNRPMVLSLSPGPTPVTEGTHVSLFANMWRLVDDLWDNWPELNHAIDVAAQWSAFRKPGHWPDIDMLPLGKLREFGPNTGPSNTQSRFTPDEARTLMTLMCINQNPLMFGGNLPETDAATLKLITNPDVLAVDQTGVGGHLDNEAAGVGQWQAGAGKDGIFVAFINRNNVPATVAPPRARHIHDLWEHHDRKPEEKIDLPAHGSVLLRIEV